MYKTAQIGTVALVMLLSGCGRLTSMLDEIVPDHRKDYTKARTLPDLSIPPGLSSGAIRDKMSIPEKGLEDGSISDFPERQVVLEKQATDLPKATQGIVSQRSLAVAEMTIMDDQHVLVVEAERYELWQKLRGFWESEGYSLKLDDADLGVIETRWLENKNKLTRNRFKIFAEPGKEEGRTIVFLSHQGQDWITVDQPYGEEDRWGEILRDQKKETELVGRLKDSLAALGSSDSVVDKQVAVERRVPNVQSSVPPENEPKIGKSESFSSPKTLSDESNQKNVQSVSSRSKNSRQLDSAPEPFVRSESVRIISVGRGKYYLTVETDFNKAWKSTRRALEVAGITVRRADKGRGSFVVDLVEGGSFENSAWQKLQFWKSESSAQYQVSVTGIGNKTELVILDPDGRWITSHEAERLLDRIYNALVSEDA